MTRYILASIVAALTFASPASAEEPLHAPAAGETATVFIFNHNSSLHIRPAGYHVGKSDSRVDAITHAPRNPAEAWRVTTTGGVDKRGNPLVTIESINVSVGAYKYLAPAGAVQDGPKDASVVGKMEIALSDTPFEWSAEETSSGVTLNVGHAPGYVLEFRGEGKCVLGWDNDTPAQLVGVTSLD